MDPISPRRGIVAPFVVVSTAIVLLIATGASLAQTFAEGTGFFDRLPEPARAGDVRMVAWEDVDADGDPDLLLLRGSGASTLVENDVSGWRIRTPLELAGPDDWTCALWIEVDDDPFPELLALRNGTDDLLLDNLGAWSFSALAPAGLLSSITPESAAAADFDLDSDLDVLVSTSGNEANRLWRYDGANTWTDVAPVWPSVEELFEAKGVAWADLDDDRAPDCFVAGSGAAPIFEINVMAQTLTFATLRGLEGQPDPVAEAFAWGDLDNDGLLDLVVGNTAGAQRRFERQLPLVYFYWQPEPELDQLRSTRALSTADVDNDGWLDVYQSNLGGTNELLRNTGSGVFTRIDQGGLDLDTGGGPIGWADVDGDGDLDLMLGASTPGGTSRLMLNQLDGAAHWVAVETAGIAPNTRGIGATVRIKVDGSWRRREIRAGEGYRSQNAAVVHFGLGSSTSIDSLTVTWPTGLVQTIVSPGIDRRIVVSEDPGSTGVHDAPKPDRGGWMRMHAAAPNPFNPRTQLRFTLDRSATIRLEIFDLAGRRVRSLHDGELGPGDHVRLWTGDDDLGRAVGSGVYLVRLSAEGDSKTQRVTLVR